MNLLTLLVPMAMVFAQTEPTVLIDQSFTLHEPGGEERIGSYALYAEEAADTIKITESVALKIDGEMFDLTSLVSYAKDEGGGWAFRSAEGTTGVDGNAFMEVDVEPNGNEWAVKAVLLRNHRGEVLDQPKTIKRSITVPDGPVLFSSARAVMGPRLQPEPGEQAVVWVEFPDDLDEPIEVKEGFSLVRGETDEQGGFTIMVRSEHQEIGPVPLDQDGKIKPYKLWCEVEMRKK
ncbi:MAG: hypothetical protein AAGB26_11695 [Planctomycetota bacterium]